MTDRYEQNVIETAPEGEHTVYRVWAEFPEGDLGPPVVVATCEDCGWQSRSRNTVGAMQMTLAHTQEFHT